MRKPNSANKRPSDSVPPHDKMVMEPHLICQ
jgi:hypothetical protein